MGGCWPTGLGSPGYLMIYVVRFYGGSPKAQTSAITMEFSFSVPLI